METEATHIIYRTVDPLDEEYARPSFKRGGNVNMHWYYFPDSYDTWLPSPPDLPVDPPDSPSPQPTYPYR